MGDLAKRDSLKSSILKLSSYIKKVEPKGVSLSEITIKQQALTEYWKRFQDVHDQILDRTGASEIDMQRIEFETIETAYWDAAALFDAMQKKISVESSAHIDMSKQGKLRVIANLITGIREFAEHNGASAGVGEIHTHITDLDRLYQQFECIALSLTTDASTAAITKAIETVQADYRVASSVLFTCNKSLAHANQQIDAEGTPRERNDNIKLPRIDPPTFDGSIFGWESFRDLYKSVIHDRDDLSAVRKFQYLKSCMRGSAELLLRNFTLTNDNYAIAWQLLLDRFDNKKILINEHMRQLMSQPSCKETSDDLKQIVNKTTESLRALENLGRPTCHWDDWIVYLVTVRLDSESRKLWEQSQCTTNDQPTWENLQQFMHGRIRALDAIGQTSTKGSASSSRSGASVRSHQVTTTTAKLCTFCEKSHRIIYCGKFKRQSIENKRDFVRTNHLCFNCLQDDHMSDECPVEKRCEKCNQKHHTILHRDSQQNHNVPTNTSDMRPTEFVTQSASPCQTFDPHTSSNHTSTPTNSVATHVGSFGRSHVLLATAIIKVIHPSGEACTFRALLDQGSQASFITERAVQVLGLLKQKVNVSVTGIGSSSSNTARSCVSFHISPYFDDINTVFVDALVLPKVTSLPSLSHAVGRNWPHINNLQLADPHYYEQDKIDVLLGADIYNRILLNDVRHGPPGSPTAQHTLLGWILSGQLEITTKPAATATVANHHCGLSIDDQLRKFWEIEQVPERKRQFTRDEQICEDHFASNYQRTDTGQFIVRLPLIDGVATLGQSYNYAACRQLQIEKRFKRDPLYHAKYTEFMEQYENLHHMEEVPAHNETTCEYFIPHHAVLKDSSLTTKLRVVFDASQKSSNGRSLNEQLLIGPKQQQELTCIIMRWRKHAVVFTADIEKMYRQILVDERDRGLQKIVWRKALAVPLKQYQLTTVTYGTSAAPYLAIKTLRQLAVNDQKRFPIGAEITLRDFYVDDVLTGCDTIEEAVEAKTQLMALLNAGHFSLRKWSSNRSEVIADLPQSFLACQLPQAINLEDGIKTLGINWHPGADEFGFKIHLNQNKPIASKRSLLSDMAKLYDPLGWLAPSTIKAKLMFQDLWRLNLQWDDRLPSNLACKYIEYRSELPSLEDIKIRRWLHCDALSQRIELHGFCDASITAYAAVVYVRVVHADGSIHVNLLAAKTKVAPLKSISIPRLELCGAVLLAQLITTITDAMEFNNVTTYAWTDSTIVLAWLNGEPSRWNVFVANRVTTILENLTANQWNHVISAENAADCASRGIMPSQLKDLDIWWHGPSWLRQSESHWPSKMPIVSTEEESRKAAHHRQVSEIYDLIDRFSSLSRMRRVSAFILRFIYNAKQLQKSHRKFGPLQPAELNAAQIKWIQLTQMHHFGREIKMLKQHTPIPNSSSIIRLTPFLHSGIIRVGGRLHQSPMSFDVRHPIIIPRQSKLTTLLIDHAHRQTLHGGVQMTSAYLRRTVWIMDARNQIRYFIHRCLHCFKQRAETQTQIMANLPAARISPSRPFLHTAIDFSGFIKVRSAKGRGQHSSKAYVSLFVCLVTKAIHLELVSDLSSAAFIASFRRFVSRRGKCTDIYSDNGTNFVGAFKELKYMHQGAMKGQLSEVIDALAQDGTLWHFSPPLSPHFNGLAEAGIKSTKNHLKRIIGESTLTFEEMCTLLTQVEAVLNSRPLYPMTADPNDFSPLTPGHFLIGDAITSVPEPSILNTNTNRLTRWAQVQRMYQCFWKRWSFEYIHHLQSRTKWNVPQTNIRIGDMVLIKEDNLPPAKWKIGRILKTFPGPDGNVRVVEVAHGNTSSKRSIVKLALLPIRDP